MRVTLEAGLLVFLLFLFPVAVYCAVMASINRRPHPVMVAGTWDFVGLLFACSGFLLVAGPAILSRLYQQSLRSVPLAKDSQAVHWFDSLWSHWNWLWLAYYVLLFAGIALLFWQRRKVTIIYNIAPPVLDSLLGRVLDQLGQPWKRQGNRIQVQIPENQTLEPLPGGTEDKTAATAAVPRPPVLWSELKLDPFPAFWNVTLTWERGPSWWRQEVERELSKSLLTIVTEDNPAGNWLLGLSLGMFAVMLLGAGLMIFLLLVIAARL